MLFYTFIFDRIKPLAYLEHGHLNRTMILPYLPINQLEFLKVKHPIWNLCMKNLLWNGWFMIKRRKILVILYLLIAMVNLPIPILKRILNLNGIWPQKFLKMCKYLNDSWHTRALIIDFISMLVCRTWVNADLVKQICGDSVECIYDYSTTLSQEFAMYSKFYQDQFRNIYENVLRPEARGMFQLSIHESKLKQSLKNQ